MKSEQIKQMTNKAIEKLIAALNVGRSEMLTQCRAAIGRFQSYSLRDRPSLGSPFSADDDEDSPGVLPGSNARIVFHENLLSYGLAGFLCGNEHSHLGSLSGLFPKEKILKKHFGNCKAANQFPSYRPLALSESGERT